MRYNLESEPVISVAMLVYNHEKYLEQALQSIFEQKVDVSYEVVIGEDCSTDHSGEIIEKWMRKYPGVIQVLPREYNLGMHENFNELVFACRGRYIAWLEGDDFWQDDHKLCKQYSYLEKNTDYVGVACNVTVVDAEGAPDSAQQKNYPLQEEGDFILEDLKRGRSPGQTGTFFHRNIFRGMAEKERSLVRNCHANGDSRIIGILSLYGKIRIMPETMSAYRFVTTGGTNWNSLTHDKNYSAIYYDKILELESLLSNLKGQKISLNISRYRQIASALLMALRGYKKADFDIFRELVKKEKNKVRALFYCSRLAVEHILR